jgi:DNA-binding NtrC family response regulator
VKTILVVDDDTDLLEIIAEALATRHRRVLAFQDPIRALEAVRNDVADLLIADLSLPWIDGVDLLACARALHPELPLLLISGHHRAAEVAAARRIGFLPKPFDLDRLSAAVDATLARAEG